MAINKATTAFDGYFAYFNTAMLALRFILLLLFVNSLSCIQPFNPPASQAINNWLVVDGFINAGSDSTNIRLSRSQTLSDTNYVFIPENGATVSVVGSNNVTYPLLGMGNGLYSSPGLNLNLSETYRLSIIASNGEQFQSDSLQPQLCPPIDSVFWRIDTTGLNIYVSTHDPTGKAKYYKWDYTETWERMAPFESLLEFVNGMLVFRPPQNQISTCWKTQNSSTVILGSTAALTQDVINLQPIEFFPSGSEQMQIEYSILLRQVVLDATAFSYWQSILNTTELTGSIFQSQPNQVTGNIHSLNNPKEPVFGWVSVGTESQERIFISRYDFSYWLYTPSQCVTTEIYGDDVGAFADSTAIVPVDQNSTGFVAAEPACADCRYGGASNEKPSFWPF
jgi:Domain of unknown function (DUF4249)